ncbi:MAG: MBL fold metallo-hydrolase [Flavobacteriales bacterium]|nr:MBL fold metallo-hydrolase [Flavobacteriales bacterium]MCX7768603.1 MBL fold metallo-hydrolase [Flavobacteriales bacterium]MDW8409743.1 MBL fold metallo-hydrolase [Flavobacteriales bacterium]
MARSLLPSVQIPVCLYQVGSLIVDSGPSNARRFLRKQTWTPAPRAVLLTHFHEDHSGNAAFFHRQFQSALYGHPFTATKLKTGFRLLPYEKIMFGGAEPAPLVHLHHGDSFEYEGRLFEVLETPGHAEGHLCFYVPQEGWLFSGDMYVAERIKIWRRSENLALQIESLEMLSRLSFDALWCGHNPQPKGGPELLKKKLEYFRWFYGLAAEAFRKGLSEKEAIRFMGLRERHLVKLLTFNDVSVAHMVRSVYETERKRAALRPSSGL